LADAQTFILKLEFRMNFVNGNLNTEFFFFGGKIISVAFFFFLGGKIITKLLLCVMQWLVYKNEQRKKRDLKTLHLILKTLRPTKRVRVLQLFKILNSK
jgi:uncharacterized paraquat-inducible protein A